MENPGKVKITELNIERMRTREYRDENGQIQHTKEPYKAGRPVNVISGFPRFLHYLIDAIILVVLGVGIGVAMGVANRQGFSNYSMNNGHLEVNFMSSLLSFGFYFFFEMLTGSTPGKMAFGRIVVDEYGERPEAGVIALRTVSRWVPFEALSCLGERGWHDKWSKTFVVTKTEAAELLELRHKQEIEAVQKISEDYIKNAH